MATLDSILGRFSKVKEDLIKFIASTDDEIQSLHDKNKTLMIQIKDNNFSVEDKENDIKRATRSIKQLNKIIGE